MTTKHENIYQAMAAVMEEVGYVKKQRSVGLNYSYAGEAALIEALRPAMVEHGVFVHVLRYFNVSQTSYTTAKGTEMTRTVLQAVIRFAHETGTFLDVESAGEGADSGDKSVNKAMTGAYKYALRQTFCIETGDDPDKYPSEQKSSLTSKAPPQPGVINNDNPPKMSLETAENVTSGKDKKRYGDHTTKELEGKVIGITSAMKDLAKGDPQYEEYQFKLDAARVILAHRNGK